MKRLARFFDRALLFSVLLFVGVAIGFLGGAAIAYTNANSNIAARASLLASLRGECLSGNGNACELYVAEINR